MIPQDIEEVEIKYKLTGDLNKDANHFGKSKKLLKLDSILANYIQAKSTFEVMKAKDEDFVQPWG